MDAMIVIQNFTHLKMDHALHVQMYAMNAMAQLLMIVMNAIQDFISKGI